MSLCLLAAAFILAKQGAVLVQSEKAAREKICIVVDAGHGGSDPGKVGINGALEKDINLSIALKLKIFWNREKSLSFSPVIPTPVSHPQTPPTKKPRICRSAAR